MKSNSYFELSDIDIPHGNSVVWRYMSHQKLMDLLQTKELHLSNALNLSDQYEISVPDSTFLAKRKELEAQGYLRKELKFELELFRNENIVLKDSVFINCWSISPYESYALWKIYLGGGKEGVAIKSTVSSLKKIIGKSSNQAYIGKVSYRSHIPPNDYSKVSIITTKKPYYDFEKELRIFVLEQNDAAKEDNIRLPVELDKLIHQIVVSPFSGESYLEEIKSLCSKKHDNFEVRKSEILDK